MSKAQKKTTRIVVKEDARINRLSQRHRRNLEFQSYGNDPFMAEDLYRMMCGEVLGYGQYRTVFNFNPYAQHSDDKADKVIKVAEYDPVPNQLEYYVWTECQKEKVDTLLPWLAPCFGMSPNGHFLIQARCKPVAAGDARLFKKVPDFFTDLKIENWGFYRGKLVCMDYGTLLRAIDYSSRTRQDVKWKNIYQKQMI